MWLAVSYIGSPSSSLKILGCGKNYIVVNRHNVKFMYCSSIHVAGKLQVQGWIFHPSESSMLWHFIKPWLPKTNTSWSVALIFFFLLLQIDCVNRQNLQLRVPSLKALSTDRPTESGLLYSFSLSSLMQRHQFKTEHESFYFDHFKFFRIVNTTICVRIHESRSESNERLRIQPAQLLHCTRWVIWCVQ